MTTQKKFTELPVFNPTGSDQIADVMCIVQLADNESQKITPYDFLSTYIPNGLKLDETLTTTPKAVISADDNSVMPIALSQTAMAALGLIVGAYSVNPDSGVTSQVNGGGATSATSAFLIKNSSAAQMFRVRNDNYISMFNGGIDFDANGGGRIYMESGSARFGALGTGAIYIITSGGALSFKNTAYTVDLMRITDGAGSTVNQVLTSDRNTFTGMASAAFGVDSITKGFMLPRMTTAQKNAISSPGAGLMIYDTDLAKACVYTTAWETITSV